MNLTHEQTAAIQAALACYAHRIERLNNGIAADAIYSDMKTQHGKPTAEAIRAAGRMDSASRSIDKLNAERSALAAAFGITL